MTLAWIYRAAAGPTFGTTIGGLGPDVPPVAGRETGFGGLQIKATPLMLNGVLYFATPDNAWAVDARSGKELWHYFWKTTGGIHIGNRGVGIYDNWLFFETPDDYLVSLDARTGKERWHIQIADVKQEYFSTPAPGDRRQPRAGRDRRRYARCARVPRSARSGNRRRAVEVVERAAEEGRSRTRRPGPTKTRCGTAAA